MASQLPRSSSANSGCPCCPAEGKARVQPKALGVDMDTFALRIVTINGSCWTTVKKFIRAGAGGAHVLCVQEHRLLKDKLDEAMSWLMRNSWLGVWEPGIALPSGKVSSGVAVLCKDCLGLSCIPDTQGGSQVVPGRAVAVEIYAPSARPMVVYSCYLHDHDGAQSKKR